MDVALAMYGGMAVPGAFWVGAYDLLPGGAYARATFGALVFVSALGLVAGALVQTYPLMVVATAAPLYQFGLIYVARSVFVRVVGREPKDAALNWETGILPDRIYAFVCTLGGIFPVAFALSPFRPVAAASAV